jgi:luciferase family oxidoreductase group 1
LNRRVLDVALSVLDLAPVGEGSTPATALANSLVLAQEVERLGYGRYWVAEHHNMPGIASSQPAVLLAHVASVTSTIRIGSGGVMLPNHAPLVVAEQFGMLEALHPGRVDLGIGRAPGTDQITALALRRSRDLIMADDFPSQLAELMHHFNGGLPDDHPFARITATPARGYQPDIWLLGSSDYSAIAAGQLGLPFSFAHHFAGGNTEQALAAYRDAFRPSAVLDQPYVMLGVAVIAAETDERARWLAGPSALAMVRLRTGRPGRYVTPEAAAEYQFTPAEKEIARGWGRSHVIGSPATVRAGLEDLVARTGADELMITTMVHGHADRIESYRLVMDEAVRSRTEQ